MKRLHFFLALASFLTFFSACKKDHTDKPGQPEEIVPVTQPGKLLGESNFNKGFVVTFEYNPDSTVHKRTTHSQGYTDEVSLYTYGNNTVDEVITRNDIKFWESNVTLQNGRQVNEHVRYFNNNGVVTQDNQIVFKYNGKGLLEEMIWDGGSIKRVFTYDNNNNLVSRKQYFSDVFDSMKEYTYTNIVDKYPAFGSFFTDARGFNMPAMSKNLVNTMKETDKNGVVKQHLEYNYQLDAQGYVISGSTYDLLTQTTHQWANNYL
jgi:hypothetical protein